MNLSDCYHMKLHGLDANIKHQQQIDNKMLRFLIFFPDAGL